MDAMQPVQPKALGFDPLLGDQVISAWNAVSQEVLEFLGRRAQACAKWPSDVSRCRLPQDLWEEQVRFVTEMISDCELSSGRVAATLGEFRPNRQRA
jgi:hypothetical protein